MDYNKILQEASEDYDYYYHQFDDALTRHAEDNDGFEYPISFRLGTSKNVNFNKESVIALIEAYNKFANKTDSDPITAADIDI